MYKVIIADDEILLRKEMVLTIPWNSFGFEVIAEASNGIEAFEIVKGKKPDVLITDIRMPGLDGLSLIEKLKDICTMKYIVVSGYSEFEYAIQAIKLGVTDYILKPIDEQNIIERMQKIKVELDSLNSEVTAVENDISEEVRGIEQDIDKNSELKKPSSNFYIHKAIKYIDKHYAENLSLKSVAEVLFISESYLSKLFVRYLNLRFTEYINSVRIAKAVELLKNEDYKIHEISVIVGYNEYRYFDTVFKKIVGITPLQYKNSCIGRKE